MEKMQKLLCLNDGNEGGVSIVKLSDISHGPDWIIWIVFFILAVISLILISGCGSGLIAGYNAASKEEKAKYDEKKLCRTIGTGIGGIAILILAAGLLEDVLPAGFAYVLLGIIIVDIVIILVVGNTVCRK